MTIGRMFAACEGVKELGDVPHLPLTHHAHPAIGRLRRRANERELQPQHTQGVDHPRDLDQVLRDIIGRITQEARLLTDQKVGRDIEKMIQVLNLGDVRQLEIGIRLREDRERPVSINVNLQVGEGLIPHEETKGESQLLQGEDKGIIDKRRLVNDLSLQGLRRIPRRNVCLRIKIHQETNLVIRLDLKDLQFTNG